MQKDRRTIARSRELRAHATDHERKLWYRLRELKVLGHHFRRQAPFGPYFLDFVEHSAKLAIELDGGQHGSAEHAARDERRDAVLQAEGYRVLRFWNYEINENLDGIVESILRELRSPLTRSAFRASTSPRGGGKP